ncbi:MAG TPA: ribosome silencing factor [Arachnia sp.]|jgi:ribosome-associated protein|nr:ribosome silencing factor [Arachnia sp.]
MTVPDNVLAEVLVAAQAAADKKGRNIVAFDVSEQLAITDVFLIASANNERQVGAIVDGVEEQLLKRRLKPTRREGDRENRWVLLDYLDFVVHVQHTEERTLYNLERLWKDCPQLPLDIHLPEVDDDDDVETPDWI